MRARNNAVGFIAIVLFLSIAGAFSLQLFMRQRSARDKLDIRVFPYTVGQWQGRDLAIGEEEYEILETRNLISREYANPAGEKLYLFIIYSETNRAVFHPPEVCMLGSGVKIEDKTREEVSSGRGSFFTNKLYFGKDDYRGLALYSYKAGKLYTDNFYLQQAYFALSQLFGKGRGGATIRVSTQIIGDEELTLKMLKDFLAQTIGTVNSLNSP